MNTRPFLAAALATAILLQTAVGQSSVPRNITAAIADAARPALDKFRDDRRKPADTLNFAGIKEGMKVAELIPGNGYYSRILAKAVGSSGKLYTVPFTEPRAPLSAALAKDPAYGNIQLVAGTPASLALPEPVDLVWTTQNYHDVRRFAPALNKAIFAALKPGGIYFIVDHAAKEGARDETVALHRIDEAVVKQEVLNAGFVLDGEGSFLRNPSDDRSQQVMERNLNRATDQFVLRFRKPAQ